MKSRDFELLSLEKTFSEYLASVLDKFREKQLKPFDKSLCSAESREALCEITLALIPDYISFPYPLLDNLLYFLDMPDSNIFYTHFRIVEGLENSVEKFLANSDQISRFFCIISLVVVLSDTFKYISGVSDEDIGDYNINRQLIRTIVYACFERKYDNLIEIHSKITEWTLVLITEEAIISRLQN